MKGFDCLWFPRSACDLPRRSAGSVEDKFLANHIFKEFQKVEMDPWTDIHYVQLQTPDRWVLF